MPAKLSLRAWSDYSWPMDRSTAEWFEFLARALLWSALVVLILSIVGTIQIATSDNALPFFEQVQRESRGLAAIGTLAAGVTAAGVLSGLGAILRVLLTLDTSRHTEYDALTVTERPRRETRVGPGS